MNIELHFPGAAPEVLRWTSDHPASSYGIGVLLRAGSGDLFDGAEFAGLVTRFGAWIEVDSEQTRQTVAKALSAVPLGIADAIRVVEG